MIKDAIAAQGPLDRGVGRLMPEKEEAMNEEPLERTFYNSYGNYTGYRFQDFRAGCQHRRQGEMAGDCAHPDNECSNSNGELSECLCDFCPCVEKDYDDEDPDEPDYSEGEQPILVIETPNFEVSGLAPRKDDK